MLSSGSVLAQNGHGTHTAGTIGAIGNNGTASGGNGRDILIGGVGTDRSGVLHTILIVAQTILAI